MDCRDRRYCKTYFAVDNRLYAFVQFDRPKIENHFLTPESMKKRKSGFTLSGKNLAAENRIFLYVATRFFLRYNEKNGGRKQMKILLTAINAKYIHSNLAVYNLRAYAAHYAKGMADSDTVEIGEYTINNQMEDILEGIYKAKPDVLMFSCYIWNIAFVEELAEEFHKLRPEVPVWVGGPEVSYETESFLREHPQITGVMIGEGEKTFCELAEYYAGESRRDKEKQKIQETQITGEGKSTEERSKPGEIPGIAYRNGDEIIFTRDTHGPDYLSTPEGRKLPVEHCLKGTPGWELAPGLWEPGEKIIDKPTFGYTGWGDMEFEKIELVGLCTDICVVSNALILKAKYPEAIISVDVSCCDGVTPEKQAAALETMKSCQIDVYRQEQ